MTTTKIPGIPQIRVDVEGLTHHVVHAFEAHADEIAALLEQEVSKAIREFKWDEEVSAIAHAVIRDIVNSQIKNAMSSMRWDETLRTELAKVVLRAMVAEEDRQAAREARAKQTGG